MTILGIFIVFAVIFALNVYLETSNLINNYNSPSLEPCESPIHHGGMKLLCNPGNYVVNSLLMYLSIYLSAFCALLLFKPDFKYLYLPPLFCTLWILLSETAIRLLHIPVIHIVPFEGDIRILENGLFLQLNGAEIITISLIIYSPLIVGSAAYITRVTVKEIIAVIKKKAKA